MGRANRLTLSLALPWVGQPKVVQTGFEPRNVSLVSEWVYLVSALLSSLPVLLNQICQNGLKMSESCHLLIWGFMMFLNISWRHIRWFWRLEIAWASFKQHNYTTGYSPVVRPQETYRSLKQDLIPGNILSEWGQLMWGTGFIPDYENVRIFKNSKDVMIGMCRPFELFSVCFLHYFPFL